MKKYFIKCFSEHLWQKANKTSMQTTAVLKNSRHEKAPLNLKYKQNDVTFVLHVIQVSIKKVKLDWHNTRHPRLAHKGEPWWRHQMKTFSVLLALCVGNSPVTSEFPSQRPVKWNLSCFFYLHLNKRLSKQLWHQWFEMPSRSSKRHCNAMWCVLWAFQGKLTGLNNHNWLHYCLHFTHWDLNKTGAVSQTTLSNVFF